MIGPFHLQKSWNSTIASFGNHQRRCRGLRAIWVGCAVAALCLSRSGPSRAGDGRAIIVLLDESKTYILPRLRAELASSGFRLVLVPPTARRPDRRDLERLAAEQDAAGGLSFFKDQQGPEVWAVDPASGKTIFRDVILGLESHDDPAGAISIRVVETLRATLLQVEHREPVRAPPPPSVEAAPAAPLRLAPADRFALRLAGGVGYSPGGVGTTDHVGISFAWKTGPRWRMALDGSLTPARLRLDGPEGEARIGLYCVGLSSGFELLAPGKRRR